MGRHTVQKSAGVLELDVISPLSAQISTLTNQVNQMNLSINKQQEQLIQAFCEICGEGLTSNICPANPESLANAQNTRPAGALPSDTEANPRAALHVVPLRNGRQLEEVQSKKRKHVTLHERPTTIESTSENAKEPEKPAGEAVDILQEVPKYTKYIKDNVANKRRLTEFETVALTEECSSRIQGKLPQKLKDPGSFTIQISIGKYAVERALCDLGESINLMLLSVFRQLGLGEPRPTTVILQLVDRPLAHPEGVIGDVLVQVGSFIFPADFIILDYEPDQEVPFILGHPFLAMGRAIIDVCEGRMTMRVGDRVEVFNVYRALKLPAHYEELFMISVV
uniref:Uncharacterized protein n=1 Tax=Nicotiana tabacum TaxID=4097 RepID=A0A1S3YM62_TOBAC|nr:PREDICTED: uncharacterized protein LOC107777738 [Nicotiana tabacum]